MVQKEKSAAVRHVAALLAAAVLAGGCAPAAHNFDEDGAYDPLEPMNRGIFVFNHVVDRFTLRPVAILYSKLPGPIIQGVGNVFNNLDEPRNAGNHLLQFRPVDAVTSVSRLVLNTTLGVGGIFDFASWIGLPGEENDLGLTLRYYLGGRAGPYLVLPLLGPATAVDFVGDVGDQFAYEFAAPGTYIDSAAVTWGLPAVQIVHGRASFLEAEEFLQDAPDAYIYIRDFRENMRRQEAGKAPWWGSE